MGDKISHYYSIAKKDSFVTVEHCIRFWNECGLKYEEADVGFINKEKVALIVKVDEDIFDPDILRKICWQKLKQYGVNVLLNTKAAENDIKDYDFVVIAAYSQINSLLHGFSEFQKDYQFELCEKPVLKLPESFKGKSIVVIDGPFTCIAPLGSTGHFVIGHVVHAIHHTNIGKLPEVPAKFKDMLNKGIIKNPEITNIKKFIEAASEFFPEVRKAEHIGSMFTIRTVPPFREYDDARPTLVERINEKTVVVFSGKIGTCVDAAEQVVSIVNTIKA